MLCEMDAVFPDGKIGVCFAKIRGDECEKKKRHFIEPDNFFSLDGFPIKEGLIVWDYDLVRGEIDLSPWMHSLEKEFEWDGWFYVHPINDQGERINPERKAGKLMNAERVWVMHP